MLSSRECLVLQQRPWQAICHLCLAKLATALSHEPNTIIESQASYQHGAGKCSVCAQFSSIVVFMPHKETKKKAASNLP